MTDTVTEPASKEVTSKITIRDMVRERLGDLGATTREQVIEHFASAEADKQAKAIIKGLDKLTALELELRKIKPSFAGYDIEGKPVGDALFTKEQLESRKKANEQIEKLTKALNKADDKNDFGDLFNMTN